MRVAVTGASGMIGHALCRELTGAGHTVLSVTRGDAPAGTTGVSWQGADTAGTAWAAPLRGVDAVVHLAGSSLAAGRWTPARKREILQSRDRGTRVLIEGLDAQGARPSAFLSMSAVGYYGMDPERAFTEADPPGDDFLARVCVAWEDAAAGAQVLGARVALLRAGVVLSADGGMLARLRLPYLVGAGGPVGSGAQWLSWISQEDAIRLILHALGDERAAGPINLTAPTPVQNRTFAKSLGRAWRRPAALPLPAPAVRLLFGEMGETVLLQGQKVYPRRAQDLGFSFRHETVEEALQSIIAQR